MTLGLDPELYLLIRYSLFHSSDLGGIPKCLFMLEVIAFAFPLDFHTGSPPSSKSSFPASIIQQVSPSPLSACPEPMKRRELPTDVQKQRFLIHAKSWVPQVYQTSEFRTFFLHTPRRILGIVCIPRLLRWSPLVIGTFLERWQGSS